MISFYPIFRWRFVIHGGIDGFSRMIVFMECSTNNRASTVCTLFRNAVHTFGLPSRVRSDKCGENADVAWLMLSYPLRGPGRGSHIAGWSVHNQRIERLWRDVYTGCTYVFYQLFYHMEESGILDSANEIHIFALHFVYLPRINRRLSVFTSGHNNGPICTERNLTPVQLWLNGLMQLSAQRSDYRVVEELNERVKRSFIAIFWLRCINYYWYWLNNCLFPRYTFLFNYIVIHTLNYIVIPR